MNFQTPSAHAGACALALRGRLDFDGELPDFVTWRPQVLIGGRSDELRARARVSMSANEWISNLRELNRKSKTGAMTAEEQELYDAGCQRLAGDILRSTRSTVPRGRTPQDVLRIRHAAQLDLGLQSGRLRTLSVEIGVREFVARVPSTGLPETPIKCSLRLPGGATIDATAHAVSSIHAANHTMVVFEFVGQSAADTARLTHFVFGTLLDAIAAQAGAAQKA